MTNVIHIDRPREESVADLEDLRLVSPAKAAELLDVSRSMVYSLIYGGALRSVHVGRAVKIRVADVRAYIGQNSSAGP